jgi:predicted NUDIX family NTP pyrophosphohydrolase
VSRKESAGLLLFRRRDGEVEVLLAHPGGPYWKRKDDGAWTIPKGEIEAGEERLAAARREFEEETGYRPRGEAQSLGSIRQPGGKVVHVWAIEDDWRPSDLASNTFEMEWPPRSGRRSTFPEIDRAQWFDIEAARVKILKGQTELLDRLLSALSPRA